MEQITKMEKIENCPICDSKESSKILECVDDTVSKEKFSVVRCVKCGFNYTNPRPNENELYKYYESKDYVSHSDTNKGLINSLYHIVRKHTLKSKVKLINSWSKKGSILDIGSGTGHFLKACNENGWKTTGIEPSEKTRNTAIKTLNLDIREESDIERLDHKTFDVITMWHVLEHVPRLNQRIEEIKNLLKNEGTLFVAVPNRTSYDAKIYQENWAGYDVPRHLYHFSPEDIKNLFKKHEFEVVEIKPMIFDSFYVSMLSEKIKTGKAKFIKGAVNGLISNVLSTKNANTSSSQIYILKRNKAK